MSALDTPRKKTRFVNHVGLQFGDVTPGRSRLTLEVQELHLNGTGVVHGGAMFTLADTAMGSALYRTLDEGEICATIEIKIGYFKPVFEGTLVCEAVVLNKGKSIASLEATIHVGDVLVSKATGTFAIFRRKTDSQIAEPLPKA